MATKEEKNEFSLKIETLSIERGTSHIETITVYCDEVGLEVEVAATLVNESLRAKIEAEAQNLRYIKRSSKLPLDDGPIVFSAPPARGPKKFPPAKD